MFLIVLGFTVVSIAIIWVALYLVDRPGSRKDIERTAQISLLGMIAVLAAAVITYQTTVRGGLAQTSALFIFIPALLASAAVFVPTRSAKGIACKSVTIGLLIGLLFLGEGMLCILMSAPLFYAVAIFMGAAIDEMHKDDSQRRMLSLVAMLSIVPMSFEGVTPATTLVRDNVVSETRTIAASADAVEEALKRYPRFERQMPWWLTIGFPRPVATASHGNTLQIEMRGGEMRLNGMEPRTGTLILRREDSGHNTAVWRAISDDSHMRHFLTWQSSEVRWRAVNERTTEVTWTIRFRRDLDPAWYFGPMERFVVRLAAGYLIDAVATP